MVKLKNNSLTVKSNINLYYKHQLFLTKNDHECEFDSKDESLIVNLFFIFANIGRADKLDNSFSRSRSSSMSSLENITSEAVTCLAFVDSYTKKSGKFTKQCIGAIFHFHLQSVIFA
jgi:hypothetical protein